MPDNVIQTYRLVKHFDEVRAVDGLTLDVGRGEVFGFLGHNGAGKTTTVRLLNGILEPTGGQARVLGFNPVTEGAALRRRTGVLTESPANDERMTARENLRYFADLYDVPVGEVKARVAALLERFELSERADDRVSEYSKGMKQRLALARALIHEPELLFLDEPTSGLDPIAAKGVRDLVLHMSRDEGRTVFIATHNLYEAQRLCDRVAVLEHGKLIAMGTPAELSRRASRSQRLEVEVAYDAVQKTLAVLEALPGIVNIETELLKDGTSIQFGGANHERIPEVLKALVAGGISVYRVQPLEPSLEDVYFALHEQENGEGAA